MVQKLRRNSQRTFPVASERDGSSPPDFEFSSRQHALSKQLEADDIPYLVVTKPANVFYLTGFHGSAGMAIFGRSGSLLMVDPRYILQAQSDARGVQVAEVRTGLFAAAAKWLCRRRARRIGFEDAHVTEREAEALRRDGPKRARWIAASGLIEHLREVKSEWEAARIRKACELTSAAFIETLPLVRPGVAERDLAVEVDFRMRRLGADALAFDTIVAAGPRGAFPHARPTDYRIKSGELVIFDLGAILAGYAADMTRTVYLGSPSGRARRLYASVLSAQEDSISVLRGGVGAGSVDHAARRRLAAARLERFFTHSTGHGVGIEIHERPRIAKGEKAEIPSGAVVTVEPGIYIEGFGGIRIEDTVLVGENGTQVLTPASKDHWFTG